MALKPPALAVDLGLAEADDYWLVLQSIYGLRESPAASACYRDTQLKAARWTSKVGGKDVELKLQQLVSDNQVWRVVRADGASDEALGYLLVYIDDLMVVGPDPILRSFFTWLSSMWECDDLSVLSEGNPIKFLGMELHEVDNGIEISQEGFIKEMLRAYQHEGKRAKTQGPKELLIMSAEEEAKMLEAQPVDLTGKEKIVKEAQRRVGELNWLSSRSRPDIQYATAVMASRITRCPEAVVTIGDRLLDYLHETIKDRLRFANDKGEEQQLRAYTDSSFAPSSGRSHGAVAIFYGTCPLAWRSSRQPLIALSTAETELMEGVEGLIMAFSTKCLLEELLNDSLPIFLHIDNSAAISFLTTAAGSWRTRHLRLRGNWVRERVQRQEVNVVHEPGDTQRADIGTKPFSKDRLKQLKELWDIKERKLVLAQARALDMKPWMQKLLLLCQMCGAYSVKENIQPEVPWDLYLVVVIMAIAVIGVWEFTKHCAHRGNVRLQALRVKASRSSPRRITRMELKELQLLMSTPPGDLTDEQKIRLVDLKEMFDESMPPNTSPVPTCREDPQPSSSSSSTHNKQAKSTSATTPRRSTREVGVQKDAPAFERVEPPPTPHVRVFTGRWPLPSGRRA